MQGNFTRNLQLNDALWKVALNKITKSKYFSQTIDHYFVSIRKHD